MKMGLAKYLLFFICLKILECHAINCRTEGGPKEAVLKELYAKCMKMQDSKGNYSKSFNDNDWRESRGYNRPERGRIKDDKGRSERDNDRGRAEKDNCDKENNRDHNRSNNDDNDGDRNRDDRMDNRNDRHSNGDDRINRNDMMNNFDNRYGRRDHVSTRDGFYNDEFGSDIYNSYSSNHPSRRYKREKHNENSGQRSQYNPNQKSYMHEDNRSKEKNSNENNSSKEVDSKACALHCFLEHLKMTGNDGKPDKYLVVNAILKEVKNEDLKDFLREAVDECFQMLENENTEEKCEFSKNLLMCLSEKGRANCDDWKDDLRF